MTALSSNNKKPESKRVTGRVRHLMANSVTIWAGSMVMRNSAGLALVAAALASNKGCVGIAVEKKISGTGGDDWIVVEEGDFYLPATTLSQANVGSPVYAEDDNTVDETQGANEPIAGLLLEYISASKGLVRMSASITSALSATVGPTGPTGATGPTGP